jgi:cell division protease FtsH
VEGVGDGQGNKPKQRSSWARFGLLLAVLLIINWIVSSLLLGPASRETVSYTFFWTQVNANNVQDITSTGDTIQGDFKKQVAYPTGSTNPTQVVRFTTQRPTFANDGLFQKLQANGVQVNAKSPDQAAPLWEQVLVGFGPTLLFVGLLVWFWRRSSAGGGLGGLGGIGRSKAKLYQRDDARRTTFEDVAGIDEVENEVMRSSTSCVIRTATADWARRSRGACCCPALRVPARRCWRARSRVRPMCRSSRCRHRSSSR